jgi:hypothetical protein
MSQDFRVWVLDIVQAVVPHDRRDQPPENVEGDRIKGRYIYNFLFLQPTDIDTSLAALRKAGLDVLL